jgi:hypothetical protein
MNTTTWTELQALAVLPRVHHRLPYQQVRRRFLLSTVQCGKACFLSRHSALDAASSIANANGDRRMSTYRCNLCHQFHLTTTSRTI